jgi:hypothetical protein
MELLTRVKDLIINPAILVVFTAGFLLFTYGLVVYMYNIREGKGHDDGVRHMLWGLAGMLIMISVYGIIGLISNTIGVDPNNPVDPSRIQNVDPGNVFGL